MFKMLRHVLQQPFVFSTGLAALIHSTWALGTLFAGEMPALDLTNLGWWYWFIPAFLCAFALDVGQIKTADEIRSGQRSFAKIATFVIFAVGTYYLQWLFMAHHMPALALAEGAKSGGVHSIATLRDLSLWIIPALLPLSTLLYTVSTIEATKKIQSDGLPEDYKEFFVAPSGSSVPALSDPEQVAQLAPVQHEVFVAVCEHCGATFEKDTERGAQNALNGHRRHCPPGVLVGVNGVDQQALFEVTS